MTAVMAMTMMVMNRLDPAEALIDVQYLASVEIARRDVVVAKPGIRSQKRAGGLWRQRMQVGRRKALGASDASGCSPGSAL
jgi:hypothetical protein